MPEQRAAEPAAKGDIARELETEQRRGVIDLPSRHDHQDNRDGIDPVHGTDPRRLDHFCRGDRGMLVAGCKAGHISSLAVPFLNVDIGLYAGKRCFVTAIMAIKLRPAGYGGPKKTSPGSPARPCASLGGPIRAPGGLQPAAGRRPPHASRPWAC